MDALLLFILLLLLELLPAVLPALPSLLPAVLLSLRSCRFRLMDTSCELRLVELEVDLPFAYTRLKYLCMIWDSSGRLALLVLKVRCGSSSWLADMTKT